jgi:hypothetical protein
MKRTPIIFLVIFLSVAQFAPKMQTSPSHPFIAWAECNIYFFKHKLNFCCSSPYTFWSKGRLSSHMLTRNSSSTLPHFLFCSSPTITSFNQVRQIHELPCHLSYIQSSITKKATSQLHNNKTEKTYGTRLPYP